MSPAPASIEVRRWTVATSGDFHFGQGHVTLPSNFALANQQELFDVGVRREVSSPSRDSIYYGATVSVGLDGRYFLDLSYAQGNSSGDSPVSLKNNLLLDSHFSIDDTWYQAYLRYSYRPTGKWTFYFRGGISYVTAELNASGINDALGLYREVDKTEDLLGNLGAGLTYTVLARLTERGAAWRLSAQVETEGFFGTRSQDVNEDLVEANFHPKNFGFNNTLYGGIGRITAKYQYAFKDDRWRAYADGGLQGKFTQIEYSDVGSFDELLWGPYIKVGISYAF